MTQQTILVGLVFFVLLAGVHLSAAVFPAWKADDLAIPLASVALIFQLQTFLRKYFFTRNRGSAAFMTDALHYLGKIAVLFWLFLSYRDEMNSASVLWAISATGTVSIVYGAFFVKEIEWVPSSFRPTVSRHWRFSKWLLASAVMRWTSANLFILSAGAMLGATAVGALKAASTLMGVTHILLMGLENVVPIRAVWHLRQGGKAALVKYLRRVGILAELATVTVAATMAAAPDFWLRLVFGNEYSGYGYVLQWFAVVYVIMFITIPLTAGVRAIGSNYEAHVSPGRADLRYVGTDACPIAKPLSSQSGNSAHDWV